MTARRTRWTRGSALSAIRSEAWALGRTPTCVELRPPLPTPRTLQRLFGSVSAAMAEAGLTPRRRGRPRADGGVRKAA